ncbi:hypothetical protein RYX36_035974 [Vicia faba]
MTNEGVLMNGNCNKLERGEEVALEGISYEVVPEDIDWAYNGLVASIRNNITVGNIPSKSIRLMIKGDCSNMFSVLLMEGGDGIKKEG